jgi:hypothetical protein
MHIEGDQVREPSSTFLIGSKSKGARNMALLPFFQSVFNSGKKFPALSRISNFPGIYPFSGKSWKLFMNPNGFFGKIWIQKISGYPNFVFRKLRFFSGKFLNPNAL